MTGELVTALEAAERGSRELDERITLAVFLDLQLERGPDGDLYTPRGMRVRVLDYTTSLDDALTLVPEGWLPLLDWWRPHVRLRWLEDQCLHSGVGASHADIRIALCIACLRARTHQAAHA